MLSLYLHIPFCQSKCNYCAFSSFPLAEKSDHVHRYLSALKLEIAHYARCFPNQEIRTIYFGGGTPNLLWSELLINLIHEIEKHFDCSTVAELSFEFNPYPEEEIYHLVQNLQKTFHKQYPRIRFSFWIQSFDNEVLQRAGRKSSFLGLIDFLRWLQPLKQDTSVFNFDFIAFGKWNQSKKGNPYLWTPSALDFFSQFVGSHFSDSFSLYTLELFENQVWKKKNTESLISWAYFWTDDQIYEEFSLLKEIILNAGYNRYELSNFALAGKSSIHNRTYREMEDYLWLGLNSSSFLSGKNLNADVLSEHILPKDLKGIRFKNTDNFENYCSGLMQDPSSFEYLHKKDWLIESFFLGLRTDKGVSSLDQYESILVSNYKDKILRYQEQEFVQYDWIHLKLSDTGMDVFNAIITDIMKEI